MKHSNLKLFIIILVLYNCDKEKVENLVLKQEYYIIAGDKSPDNVYFDYIPDFTLDSGSWGETKLLTSSFDINKDSIPDLYFYKSYEVETFISETTQLEEIVNSVSTSVKVINTDSLNISPWLLEGDTINKETDWYSSLNLITCTDYGCESYGPDYNDLCYMGVCFYKKNDTIYGWLLMSPNLTVYEAALNKLK